MAREGAGGPYEGSNPGRKEDEEGPDLAMEAKKDAMAAFLKAIDKKDTSGMAHAFKDAYDACMEATEE